MSSLLLQVTLGALLMIYPATTCHPVTQFEHDGGQTAAIQSSKAQKFQHAIVRSKDAAKIIEVLNEVRDVGFPRELVNKAEGIAIFPLVDEETALFMLTVKGYGVISARTSEGWSLPAFYGFTGGGYTGKFISIEEMAVVLLFMNKEAMAWFEKGGVQLKDRKKAVAGPVGTVSDEQRKELAGAGILSYVYSDSKLKGNNFGTTFKNFLLNPDNNINKPIYGMKGREVLAGKAVEMSTVPVGITAFKEALEKYYPKR
jgi:lipid-binding SYLF domain-containing protein